jgi:hypothetical protein
VESKDELMSIATFFAVKKAAKNMVAFLRMRQKEKKDEIERLKHIDVSESSDNNEPKYKK